MNRLLIIALALASCKDPAPPLKSNDEINAANDREYRRKLREIDAWERDQLLNLELRKLGLDSLGNPIDTTR